MTRPLGDGAVLVDVPAGHRAAQGAAAALRRAVRARDVVPAACTVGVAGADPVELAAALPGTGAQHAGGDVPRPRPPAVHEIPVVLDGEDAPSVAAALGRDGNGLASLVASCELEVAWLGFMPGFAYLAGLPGELGRLPRRAVPRTAVPAGSFAVAGGYAGIYPSASPGGWNLLGRTAFGAFDPDTPPYAALQPGDRVRLVPSACVEAPPAPARPLLAGHDLEVLDPGPLLLVEDLGRAGAGHLGVPRAGSANSCWLSVANLAAGNEEHEPALELAGGALLLARRDLLVALAGDATLSVGGTRLPAGVVAAAGPGQVVEVGPIRSRARAVLAVGGGVAGERRFESASGDAVSGLPPGPLRAGDVLDVGAPPARARRSFELPDPRGASGGHVVLRAIAGPDAGAVAAAAALTGTFEVDRRSDRTGVRLRRGPVDRRRQGGGAGGEVPSHAVVPGCVQVPPSGDPVVLGPDCGPVGGYAVTATVICADLWRVGTLAPGESVVIELVSLEEAATAKAALDKLVRSSVRGWFPTRAG